MGATYTVTYRDWTGCIKTASTSWYQSKWATYRDALQWMCAAFRLNITVDSCSVYASFGSGGGGPVLLADTFNPGIQSITLVAPTVGSRHVFSLTRT